MFIYKYITLNLLFLVFCIPIVTIPAAMAGLFAVSRKIVYEDEPAIFSVFWMGFRQNLKQSSIVGLAILVLLVLFTIDFRVVHMAFGGVFMIAWDVLMLIAIATFIHVYPLMVHMNLTTRQLVLNALKLTMVKPLLTLCNIVLLLGFIYLSSIIPILFFTFFFSISATMTFWLVDKKYRVIGVSSAEEPETDEQHDGQVTWDSQVDSHS
jgi:uncharacterized membrane protein YesL